MGGADAHTEVTSQVESENENPAYETYCSLFSKNYFCRHASVSDSQF